VGVSAAQVFIQEDVVVFFVRRATAKTENHSAEKCTLQNQHKHLQRHQVGRTRA